MPTGASPAALGRGGLLAKAGCLVASAALVASLCTAAGSFQQRDSSKHELGAAAKKMAVVVPIAEVAPALGRIGSWAAACSDGFELPVDLILYVHPKDAEAYDPEFRSRSHWTVFDMRSFEHFNFVVAENVRTDAANP